ncbi:MAG: ATP-binding cassette domain-containing protein [Nitriliruptoraceae bacterium]|nr:ATP-binding cassette domain-containing protein [Nitriliruptoraceae bacterium]
MLAVTGLHKTYRDIVALDGVSMRAAPGRLVGFLGPNGAGKTTTMRSIFGLLHLDAGEVTWDGRPIDSEVRLRFGYMPEQRGLYPRMPIGRQLIYFARMHGLDRAAAQRATRSWLEHFGLGERIADPLDDLSHGNQQRVQLAAALVHEPDLLVLDEPFSGLDPLGVHAMSEVLRERARNGTTVVFSSHQLELVEELCDDVVIVAHGRTRLEGTLAEARAAATYRNVEVRLEGGQAVTPPPGGELLGSDDGIVRLRVPVATDARALVAHLPADAVIEHLSFTAPRLTEVFRDVVGASLAEIEAEHAADGDAARAEVVA